MYHVVIIVFLQFALYDKCLGKYFQFFRNILSIIAPCYCVIDNLHHFFGGFDANCALIYLIYDFQFVFKIYPNESSANR